MTADELYDAIMSSSDKKEIERKLSSLWRLAVHAEYGDKCYVCGGIATDTHHYIKKSQSMNLKYDVDNGIPLCHKCHIEKVHKYDKKALSKIKKKMGKERLEYLEEMKEEFFKNNISNLRDKAQDLYMEYNEWTRRRQNGEIE